MYFIVNGVNRPFSNELAGIKHKKVGSNSTNTESIQTYVCIGMIGIIIFGILYFSLSKKINKKQKKNSLIY